MGSERNWMLLSGVVALSVLASCHEEPAGSVTAAESSVLTIAGTITEEGVECPALRDENKKLYTLAGSTAGYGPGDEVCVKGEVAENSICMQGTTITVEWIGPAAECE